MTRVAAGAKGCSPAGSHCCPPAHMEAWLLLGALLCSWLSPGEPLSGQGAETEREGGQGSPGPH